METTAGFLAGRRRESRSIAPQLHLGQFYKPGTETKLRLMPRSSWNGGKEGKTQGALSWESPHAPPTPVQPYLPDAGEKSKDAVSAT